MTTYTCGVHDAYQDPVKQRAAGINIIYASFLHVIKALSCYAKSCEDLLNLLEAAKLTAVGQEWLLWGKLNASVHQILNLHTVATQYYHTINIRFSFP